LKIGEGKRKKRVKSFLNFTDFTDLPLWSATCSKSDSAKHRATDRTPGNSEALSNVTYRNYSDRRVLWSCCCDGDLRLVPCRSILACGLALRLAHWISLRLNAIVSTKPC